MPSSTPEAAWSRSPVKRGNPLGTQGVTIGKFAVSPCPDSWLGATHPWDCALQLACLSTGW